MQQEKAVALIEQARMQVQKIAWMEHELFLRVRDAERDLRHAEREFTKLSEALSRMHGYSDESSRALRNMLSVSMHPTSVFQNVDRAAVMVAIAEAQAIEIQREVEARIP